MQIKLLGWLEGIPRISTGFEAISLKLMMLFELEGLLFEFENCQRRNPKQIKASFEKVWIIPSSILMSTPNRRSMSSKN